jgi:hypothetical protein
MARSTRDQSSGDANGQAAKAFRRGRSIKEDRACGNFIPASADPAAKPWVSEVCRNNVQVRAVQVVVTPWLAPKNQSKALDPVY